MASCASVTMTDIRSFGRWEWIVRLRTNAVWLISNSASLLLCKAIIGGASALDTYYTLKYVESLHTYELNPVGRWLMALDSGPHADTQQIAAFIAAKFLGTVLVLIILHGLSLWRARLGGAVAVPVAIFQLSLVVHLFYGAG